MGEWEAVRHSAWFPAHTIVNLFGKDSAETIVGESPALGEIKTHECSSGGTVCDSWSNPLVRTDGLGFCEVRSDIELRLPLQ